MMHPRDAVDRLNGEIPEFKKPRLVGANWIIYFIGMQIDGANLVGFWVAAKRGDDESKIERVSLAVHSIFGRTIYPEDLLTVDGYNEVKHKVLDTKDKLLAAVQKEDMPCPS